MLMLKLRLFPVCLLLAASFPAIAEPVWLGRFSGNEGTLPAPWVVEHLNPKFPATRYAFRRWDGVNAIEAHASKSMALLGRSATVDLQKNAIFVLAMAN